MLATDTTYAENIVTELRESWVGDHDDDSGVWTGDVAFAATIRLTPDGGVDQESIDQALESVPVGEPENSRIIFLAAHARHAMSILETVQRIRFQSDAVWVGTSAWVARRWPAESLPWIPDSPGYLGVTPHKDQGPMYQRFLEELQNYQKRNNKPVSEELFPFAAETVDAIVGLTRAISASDNRRDGPGIVDRFRTMIWDDGVSGAIEIDETSGDRLNPKYDIVQSWGGFKQDDLLEYTSLGTTGATVGSAILSKEGCFPPRGVCGEPPRDTDPVKLVLPVWTQALFSVLALALIAVGLWLWKSRRSLRSKKAALNRYKDSIIGLVAATCDAFPCTCLLYTSPSPRD